MTPLKNLLQKWTTRHQKCPDQQQREDHSLPSSLQEHCYQWTVV